MERNNSNVLETGRSVGEKITDTADKVLEPLRRHEVDEEVALEEDNLVYAGSRLNDVRDKVNRGEVDLSNSEVSYEDAVEGLQSVTSGLTRNIENAANQSILRLNKRPGHSFGNKGRALQTEDAIEAATYLTEEASDQEIAEAAAAYADSTSLEIDQDYDGEPGTGGLTPEGGFDTEAERAMDIINQHDVYEKRQ